MLRSASIHTCIDDRCSALEIDASQQYSPNTFQLLLQLPSIIVAQLLNDAQYAVNLERVLLHQVMGRVHWINFSQKAQCCGEPVRRSSGR